MFPGRPLPGDGTPFQTVGVRATLSPRLEGETVYLQLLDVDDPSSSDWPIDPADEGGEPLGGDNRTTRDSGGQDHGYWIESDGVILEGQPADYTLYETTTDSQGEVFATVRVSLSPGDNYIATASLNGFEFGEDDEEVALIPQPQRTTMLTVWRRFHVEVDSMGASDHEIAEGETDPQELDDPQTADVPTPDLHHYDSAFHAAYVTVHRLPQYDDPQTYFGRSFNSQESEAIYYWDSEIGINQSQQDEHRKFWVGHVVSVYQGRYDGNDNDPESEFAPMGGTLRVPPIVPETSAVYDEVVRDVAAQHGMDITVLRRVVALHEVGHQFGLRVGVNGHANAGLNDSVMWAPGTDAEEALADDGVYVFDDEELGNLRNQGRRSPPHP